MYEALTDRPENSVAKERYRVLIELGDCHAALNEARSARGYYEDARDLAPAESDAYVGIGELNMHAGDMSAARQAFDMATYLNPSCAKAYAGLATMLHHAKDYRGAFDMYLKCLELDTDNLMALLGLFQTSCRMGTFAQIIHYLEVFLQGHPDDTSVLFCLATLQAREGKLQEAGIALRKVLSLEPGKIEAARLLAQVAARLASRTLQENVA